jgi:hypothetical protein
MRLRVFLHAGKRFPASSVRFQASEERGQSAWSHAKQAAVRMSIERQSPHRWRSARNGSTDRVPVNATKRLHKLFVRRDVEIVRMGLPEGPFLAPHWGRQLKGLDRLGQERALGLPHGPL